MTGSEFAFLAMGLGLGVAAGAALLAFLRARPSSSREVRITMTPGAIPRRHPSTFADAGLPDAASPSAPARGGPADHDDDDVPARPVSPPGSRTPVLDPGDAPVATPAFRLAEPMPRRAVAAVPPHAAVPPRSIAVSGGIDPMLAALRASAAANAEAAMQTRQAAAGGGSVGVAAGVPTTAAAASSARGSGGGHPVRVDAGTPAGGPSGPGSTPSDAGPCGDLRRLADERCTLAERARAQATSAEGAHRAAQHEYDDHEAASAEAASAADARAVRRAKDDAQARFRAGRAAATTTDEVEAVARAWLLEMNEINAAARDAAAALARERERGQTLALDLERTSLAADTARISAETAEAACLAAREALADCEERSASGRPGDVPPMASGHEARGDDHGTDGGGAEARSGALGAEGSPRIFRLLHGDRTAMHELVTALAGGDANERRRWQVALSDLVDAVIADALAASALDFPSDHAFWGPFTRAQARDITAALSSLGYRYDGLGGWSDERIPSQRDLSLALGYAGLDPMRMRHWPTEREMADLFADVRVAAAEHLAGAAGDLTLGELVTMLGPRADGLAEIWNEWGRIRPLLLEEA